MPSLEKLAQLNRWSVMVAFPLLTLGFATGVFLLVRVQSSERQVTFADPTVICSVVLLLLNDRVLKGDGPPWLTGKLSDFAGVYLVAMIVGIVTVRPDVAVATTGAGSAAN